MTTRENILLQIQKHRSELNAFGISMVGLFGSYRRNEPSEKSDIDILVDFLPEKENFDNYMAVCQILENLFKDIKVEVVTKNGLSPYLGPAILKEVMYAY